MRVGVDLDGVVYKWEQTARYLLETHRGYRNLGVSTYWEYLPDRVAKADWDWLWSEGIHDYGLFRHGNVYKGAFDALDRIGDLADLIIITSRPGNAQLDTIEWLDYHRVPYAEAFITANPKSSICCDVYLDDSPKNVKDLAKNTAGRVLLMDRPWNKHSRDGIRVFDWPDVLWHVLDKKGSSCRGCQVTAELIKRVAVDE